MRQYKDLLEKERRRLIWVSDAIVDNNPLWLLRLPNVRMDDVMPLFEQLKALFVGMPKPVYYEQIFTALRDAELLCLLEEN